MQQTPRHSACPALTRVGAGTGQVAERLFFATTDAEVRLQNKTLG